MMVKNSCGNDGNDDETFTCGNDGNDGETLAFGEFVNLLGANDNKKGNNRWLEQTRAACFISADVEYNL